MTEKEAGNVQAKDLIGQTINFVKISLAEAEAGHDWFHIERVWKNAQEITRQETARIEAGGKMAANNILPDGLIIELGALLHDIADSKFHGGDENLGPSRARAFLTGQDVEETVIFHVEQIIRHISFKGGNNAGAFRSKELDIVQDADRLDALGAIGIARAFHFGGYRNRKMYDPAVPPNLNMSREEYKKSDAPTINHFYEKLFRLKDLMNTNAGKEMAAERHRFMELYVEQFYKEWEGR